MMSTGAVVGALACQRDSYLKSFTSKVVSCVESKPKVAAGATDKKSKKKKSKTTEVPEITQKLYEVELEDTILFPEGGGQPSDSGFLITQTDNRKIPVDFIQRNGLKAVHLISEPIEPGSEVNLELNWLKRFDHMQQHTGQHLLSAILDELNLPTLGWHMGDMINYIELPKKLTDDEIANVSSEVNSKISENIPIHVEVPHKDDVKKDKMPDDYDIEKGVLRVVHIGKLDSNPCCGTHLSSTSQIKGVVLLNQVPGHGSNSRLNFIAGDRVFKYAGFANGIIRGLVSVSSCQPEQLVDVVSTVTSQAKRLQSRESNLLKELAVLKGQELVKDIQLGKQKFYCFHRPDVGLEFLNTVFKGVSTAVKEGYTVVLMSGEGKEGGAAVVFGDDVDVVVGELKKLLGGLKGGGKGKFQGKITAYGKGELESVKKKMESLQN